MAFVRDFAITETNAATSPVTVALPYFEATDCLLFIVSKDGSGTVTCGTSGWAQAGTTQLSSGSASAAAVFYKPNVVEGEAAPQVTLGTADGSFVICMSIADADPTTPIDTTPVQAAIASASQYVQPGVTSTTADCLILYLLGIDGTGPSFLSAPGMHFLASGDNAGSTYGAAAAAAWTIQRYVGTSPDCNWTGSIAATASRFTIAIRNKSGGRVPAYVSPHNLPGVMLTPGHHFSTLNNISFPAAFSAISYGNPNARTAVFDAAAAGADFGINPYSGALNGTPAIADAATYSGFEIDITGNIPSVPSYSFVVGSVIAANPRDAAYDLGSITEGGMWVLLGGDTRANGRMYKVFARDSSPDIVGRSVFAINPQCSVTLEARYTQDPIETVDTLRFLCNCPRQAIGYYVSEIHYMGVHIVLGGTSAAPVDIDGLASIGKHCRIPLIQKSGAAAAVSYVPLSIGNNFSLTPVNFELDGTVLQFPRIASEESRELSFHANPLNIGILYAGGSGDVIKHTNSLVVSPSLYYWEIGNNTGGCSYDFSGLTVIGAKAKMGIGTFSGISFTDCPFVELVSTDLTDCIVNGSFNDAAVRITGTGSMTGCTLDARTTVRGKSLARVADPSMFADCTFIGSSTSGHAIEITAAGTYNLSGNTFTGFGSDTSTTFGYGATGEIVGRMAPLDPSYGPCARINSDGTKVWIKGSTTWRSHTLSIPYMIESLPLTFSSGTLSTATQTAGKQFTYAKDGAIEYAYVWSETTGASVYQYQLTTAGSFATGSYIDTYSIATQDSALRGLAIKPDGTRMYALGDTNNTLYQYTLSPAFYVNSAVHFGVTKALPSYAYAGLAFASDGSCFYVLASGNLQRYTMSTPWDITTATLSGTVLTAAQLREPAGELTYTGITLSDDGLYAYLGNTAGKIVQVRLAVSAGGNTAIYNNSGGSVTLNILSGDVPTIRNGAGASTTVVSGQVTTTVTAVTTAGAAIQDAQVMLKAAAGGPMSADVTVTITNSGTTATVTHTAHPFATGDKVLIKGASHWQNNGVFSITVTGANTYTYTLPSAPGSNPTGTIKATYVALHGTTNASGQISALRSFTSDQPVTGWVRKATSPYYKTAQLTGTIDNVTGASLNAILLPDA